MLRYHGPEANVQQAAIRRILHSTGAQVKLTIGQPGDKYEQEADRVADEVMRMPEPGVRLHSDVQAAESARALNMKAYTQGEDVVFGTGQYTLGTSEGQRLMAHELTHVVQQSGKKIELRTKNPLNPCNLPHS